MTDGQKLPLRVLVTGATGYIGGRLVPRLVELGHRVSVLVRDRRRYAGRAGKMDVEILEGDVLDPDSLEGKLAGFDAAFYLVHSMLAGRDFDDRDRRAASNFARAVDACPHVIYLGGLVPQGDERTSEHLRSRAATGEVLRATLPDRVTEFRAGPIIGSGSASFEMVRYLTERLPVMITPKWVSNEVQPIAIGDVLEYLLCALDLAPAGVVDVGGTRLSFREMMQVYAQRRGLAKRRIFATPVLAPGLASRWVGLVTPIPNRLAVPLVAGVVRPLLADTTRARELFPGIEPTPYAEAVDLAIARIEKNMVETRWSGSLGDDDAFELIDQEGLIREVRRAEVNADQSAVFQAFSSLGGAKGWLTWNWAWKCRGWLDKIVGGPGLRRGRRHPTELFEGETVDFWRVERVEPPNLLRLRAEMKVPGRAWLQFEAASTGPGTSTLTQTALFEPKGLPGILYWNSLYPIHLFIFRDMVRAIARDAEKIGDRVTSPGSPDLPREDRR